MARTVRMSRGQLRRIIKEEASRLAEVGEHPRSWMRNRQHSEEQIDELGRLLSGYVLSVGLGENELKVHIRSMGATPRQIERIIDAAGRLEESYSEATASPEKHNQEDWDEAKTDIEAVFAELGIKATLDDFNIYFPVEEWEDREDDDY